MDRYVKNHNTEKGRCLWYNTFMEVPIIANNFPTLARDAVGSETDFPTNNRFYLSESEELFDVHLSEVKNLLPQQLWKRATITLAQIPLEEAGKNTLIGRMRKDKSFTEKFVARTMPLQEHMSAFYGDYKKYQKAQEEVYSHVNLTPQTTIEFHLGKQLVATSGSEANKRSAFLKLIGQPAKVVYGEMSLSLGDLVSLMDSCRNEDGQIERDAVVQLIDEKLKQDERNTLIFSTYERPIDSFIQRIGNAGFGRNILSYPFEQVLTRMQNYLERGSQGPYSEKGEDYQKFVQFVEGLGGGEQKFLKEQFGIIIPSLASLRKSDFDSHNQKQLKEMVKVVNDFRQFVVGVTREVENGLDAYVTFSEKLKNGETRKCAEYLTNQVLGDLFDFDLVNQKNGYKIASLWKEVVRSARVLTRHCYEIAQDIKTEFLEPLEVG